MGISFTLKHFGCCVVFVCLFRQRHGNTILSSHSLNVADMPFLYLALVFFHIYIDSVLDTRVVTRQDLVF